MRQSKTIGSILLDVELVTPQDIDQALELQKQTGKRLGEVLVQLGVVSDDDIRWALAEQLNLPYVNIRKDQVDAEMATLLPEKLARRYHVIPILKIDNELTVVVDDPLNTTIIKDIERITKSDVKISLGRTSDILLAVDEIYGSSEDRFQIEQETPPQFISPWFQGEEDIQKILNDPSGQVLMDRILVNALVHGVSRIYFQPGLESCHVSYRVNGVLQEQIQLSKEWYSILLFRLKINADFEMSSVQHPQYREFTYQSQSMSSEETQALPLSATLAISVLPTASGESAVLTVINKPTPQLWEQLRQEAVSDLQKAELAEIYAFQAQLRHRKSGAVLLGGSPYFDKMTTLYAMLNEFDPVRKKIVTLESYSEYRADNYYQIRYSGEDRKSRSDPTLPQHGDIEDSDKTSLSEITPDKKSTPPQPFSQKRQSSTLLSPETFYPAQQQLSSWLGVVNDYNVDVLLIDHIESDVVVSQCLDFAGHGLLFAAIDFPNVFEMLAYLLDCQVKPSILTSRVHALIAQQSVRILCHECKQKDETETTKHLLERFLPESEEFSPDIYAPKGCSKCHMSGYSHYVILFEVLGMESWLKDMLRARNSLKEIQGIAEKRSFQSFQKKGLQLLLSGETSVEEIFSILT